MSCKPLFLIPLLTVLLCTSAVAQEQCDSVEIYFLQGSSSLIREYADNGMALDRFVEGAKDALSKPSCRAFRIHIRSGSSPEGKFSLNRFLGEARAASLKDYLCAELSLPEEAVVSENLGENWESLVQIVDTMDVPARTDIKRILQEHSDYIEHPRQSVLGSPKKELMELNGGKTWIWMEDNIFHLLRVAVVRMDCTYDIQETTAPVVSPSPLPIQDTEENGQGRSVSVFPADRDSTVVPSSNIKKIILAPRTNLLVPFLNVGLEVPVGRRLSFAGDFYYPWIGFDKMNANCAQALLADVQLRLWFRPRSIEGLAGNSMTGSSLAVGVCAGYYDFERNMKGLQGEIVAAYLDYGYSLYLSKHCRMTFSAGLGVAEIPYRTYTVYTEGGKLIRDGYYDMRRLWIGPVHAGVTLSVPITESVK